MAANNPVSNQCHLQHNTERTKNNDYATELLSIKKEINELKTIIANAMEQFKTAIATFAATTWSPQSSNMDTDVKALLDHNNNTQTPIDLAALIQDLKYEITTIITET